MNNSSDEVTQVDEKYNPTNALVVLLTFTITLITAIITGAIIVTLEKLNISYKNFDVDKYGLGWLSFLLGYLAFWLYNFKRRQQFWYGIFETAFGFFSMVSIVGRMKDTINVSDIDTLSIIGSLSAVYLIIRGLSNISDGYSKPFKWKNIVSKFS